MNNNSFKLFIKITNVEILIIAFKVDEQNNLNLLEKLNLSISGFTENKISNIETITNLIKNNILIIEQKIKYTFKNLVVILDSFEISFLNFTGFQKLNGTQISRENITYILNSLKSCVDLFEKKKKILHIFNSNYILDKKKIENLPIGLFGDFYSHELSFHLINENDYKNLNTIFEKCNLKISKILLDSFVKSSFISDSNYEIDTFYYIHLTKNNTKIFYVENHSVKLEEKFKFGTDIVSKDISKVTSLKLEMIKKFILNNEKIEQLSDDELIEKEYFNDTSFRKIKKRLIKDVAAARIKELSELIYISNINFKKFNQETKIIFLEIDDLHHLKCFKNIYYQFFNNGKKFDVRFFDKIALEDELEAANRIVQFGWKKEAIPTFKTKKSILARFFAFLFNN